MPPRENTDRVLRPHQLVFSRGLEYTINVLEQIVLSVARVADSDRPDIHRVLGSCLQRRDNPWSQLRNRTPRGPPCRNVRIRNRLHRTCVLLQDDITAQALGTMTATKRIRIRAAQRRHPEMRYSGVHAKKQNSGVDATAYVHVADACNVLYACSRLRQLHPVHLKQRKLVERQFACSLQLVKLFCAARQQCGHASVY